MIPSTQVYTTFQWHVNYVADITLSCSHSRVPDQMLYHNPQGELLEKPNQDQDRTLQPHSYCIRVRVGHVTGVLTGRNLVTERHTRGACVQREGRVKRQQGGSHQQAKERGLRRNQTRQHLHLGLPASRTVRK